MLKQYGAVITFALCLILLGITVAMAEELTPQQKELQCRYKAGITMRTQLIRQETGDTWEQYLAATSAMYKHDDGLLELHKLAKLVYDADPKAEKTPQEFYDATYKACWARWDYLEQHPEIEL